jgi:gamma-glutamyltranspeptidase/glutathione hydrolase
MSGVLPLADPYAVSGKSLVTAAAPAAARAGLEILRAGGNAFDAAVAACAMETIWLPMKCGLAGDLVALVLEKGTKLRCLISIGAGVRALDEGEILEKIGPRSVGVPGAPAGYAELARFGRFSLKDLVEPAARQAERGLFWLPYAVTLTREAEAMLRRYNGPLPYLPKGEIPVAGAPLHLHRLAALLRTFSEKGASLFHGDIGCQLVKKIQNAGGILQESDLHQETPEWVAPLSCTLPNGKLFATPLPTHGAVLVKAVEILISSSNDPLSAFREARASFNAETGDGTSVVTASDRDGNVVVVVHSNSFPQYGSGLVVEDLQLVLNNRPGRGFSLTVEADHWNAPKHGRRPFTTLNAWALADAGDWWLGATPGGANQAAWNLQIIHEIMAGNQDISALVTSPRWGFDAKGSVIAEEGHPEAARFSARSVPALTMTSAEQIIWMSANRSLKRAAADPRIGGMALAAD